MNTNKFEKDILVSMVVYGTQADEIKEVIDFMNLENLNLSYNFLIIDNLGSSELSAFCKTIQNKSIEYLYPGNNVGFGSGHNIAAKHYSSIHHRTHLILNPDVYISDECIRKIYSFINADENISIVSPKLLNEDGSVQNICRLLPSVTSLIKRFINKIFSINRANIEDKFNLVKKPTEVPSIHGACFFVKSDFFKSVNGFDERYFLYVEDIDLCRKLNKHGKIIFYPEFSAIHKHAKGSYKNLKLFRYHFVSFFNYFLKWGFVLDSDRKKINKRAIEKIKLLAVE